MSYHKNFAHKLAIILTLNINPFFIISHIVNIPLDGTINNRF